MSKDEWKAGYEHYFKPARLTDYPEGHKHVLVNSPERFDKFIALLERKEPDECAVDLETTSLDYDVAKIVGMGVCFEDKRSFYFPFRHKVDADQNLSKDNLDELVKRIIYQRTSLWYNFSYDGQILEKEGYEIEGIKYYEVMGPVWLADTNQKELTLEWAAEHFLGWKLQKFEDLIQGLVDFSYLSPRDALFYAATDPLATWNLKRIVGTLMEKESGFIVKLDNKVILPLIRAQQEDHVIDLETVEQVGRDIESELPKMKAEIWKRADQSFNIDSPTQVARALESMGIDTGQRTKKGEMVTRADLLEKVDHPITKKVVKYKKMAKWQSSFVQPLKELALSNRPVRFKYFVHHVPTGRFAAGKEKATRSKYFAPVNIQAILKPEYEEKYAWHDKGNSDTGILGWTFSEEMNDYPVEVPKLKFNVRHAIKAPPGFWFVRCDYAGQELRIPANLSKEPTWIDAFLNERDIHLEVAAEVFGKRDQKSRQETKAVNFGIIYGATAYSYARKFNKTKEEGERFYSTYKARHKRLFEWIKQEQRIAARQGVCYTPFGRPRRLYHYFASSERRVRQFAERSVINSIVQGGAADIFRISFVNLYHKVFKKHLEICRFQMGVHDEIDFLLRKDSMWLLDEIVSIMRLKRKDWPVSMDVGVDIGTSWGDLVAFEKSEDEWRPKKVQE